MKSVKSEIIVNHTPFETRVAILEDGKLVEFYLERPTERGLTGNIYKGKIVRVLPGMQASFVEVGLKRTAFLHVTDIYNNLNNSSDFFMKEEADECSAGRSHIQEMITSGQEILVQVEKEPLGSKGARITSHISLPGRYLVLMPTYNHVGVSRRIANDKERQRLRDIVAEFKPEEYGFIVRTASEDMKSEDIKADMDYLIKLWKSIVEKDAELSAPALVNGEPDLILRTVRDRFTVDIDKFVIDSKEEFDRVEGFIDDFMPELTGKVELYDDKEPIFDFYGIEPELADALSKKVWLKSGGFIVIDLMEALTAIDVNTGSYVGKKNSHETILKTNLEAVKEVVHQLRLRNIGGIIVIDFIDMERLPDKEKVYNTLKKALKIDKARTNIFKISELGIVEMTRKRMRSNITQLLCEPCPYCEGNGMIKGKNTIVMEIYRDLLKDLSTRRKRKVTVYTSPSMSEYLQENMTILNFLEDKFKKKIHIKTIDLFHQEQYEVM